MSRHGPSALGFDLLDDKRANLDAAAVFRPRLARVRGLIAGVGDRDQHRPTQRAVLDAVGDLGFEEVGPALGELLGRDRDELRRRRKRPAHRVVIPGTVGEDEAVKAVVALLGIAARPGRALGPGAERCELGIAPTNFAIASGSLLAEAIWSAWKASGVETGKNGGSIIAMRHSWPSGVEIMTPKPRTRTLASSAFGSGVARLKRPTTGYGLQRRPEPATARIRRRSTRTRR